MAILAECPICKRRQAVANKVCKCGEKLDKAKRSERVRYWIDYSLPGGKVRREFVGMSIEGARAADGKRKGQKKEGRLFDILPETKKTFNQLAEWFTGQKKIKALSYFVSIQAHLKLFNAALGDRLANSLTPSDLENLQVELKEADYSPSYIDQTIDTARYMVTKAFDNDQIGGDCLKPFRKVAPVLKRGANTRKRILTMAEYTRLHAACPVHLQGIVALGFWTGMRIGEILPLTWEKVDLPARVIRLHSTDTKEAMSKTVPIPKRVRDMLLTLPHRGKGEVVFTFRGKPLVDIRDGLKRGCKVAKIRFGRKAKDGFVFHDLRHTFATNARRAGIPKNVTMAIMGHSAGTDMNARYDLVEESDLLAAIDKLEDLFPANLDLNLDPEAILNR